MPPCVHSWIPGLYLRRNHHLRFLTDSDHSFQRQLHPSIQRLYYRLSLSLTGFFPYDINTGIRNTRAMTENSKPPIQWLGVAEWGISLHISLPAKARRFRPKGESLRVQVPPKLIFCISVSSYLIFFWFYADSRGEEVEFPFSFSLLLAYPTFFLCVFPSGRSFSFQWRKKVGLRTNKVLWREYYLQWNGSVEIVV